MVLRIKGNQPFGIGGRRLCFEHPDDPGKCIKVLRTDNRRTVRHTKLWYWPTRWRRQYDNNAHEEMVLTALFHRIGPAMTEHLPNCYGRVETDLGSGLVLDLYREPDGTISRNLRELLSNGHDLETFRPAFELFCNFLLENRVLTRALLDHNLVVQSQTDGNWHFYLIDGFGDRAWVPISSWIAPVGQYTIRQRISEAWSRFEKVSAKAHA